MLNRKIAEIENTEIAECLYIDQGPLQIYMRLDQSFGLIVLRQRRPRLRPDASMASFLQMAKLPSSYKWCMHGLVHTVQRAKETFTRRNTFERLAKLSLSFGLDQLKSLHLNKAWWAFLCTFQLVVQSKI